MSGRLLRLPAAAVLVVALVGGALTLLSGPDPRTVSAVSPPR